MDEDQKELAAPTYRRRIKILHVITGLSRGGAETALFKLLSTLKDDERFSHAVIALTGTNVFDFQSLGVPVILADIGGKSGHSLSITQLVRLARHEAPDIVQGWMYHANIAASAIAPMGVPVIQGIRCSLDDITREKRLTRVMIRMGPLFARVRKSRIIYCSSVSRNQHEMIGYPKEAGLIIPNGFDCDLFKPDQDARARLLADLNLPNDSILIGHAARFHPMKDHQGFLRAFAMCPEKKDKSHLLMAGRGVSASNHQLMELVDALGLRGRVHLLGEQQESWQFFPGLDFYVSSSAWGEAFPNVLGEAMACAIPCVTTNVGDSAFIVGDTGAIAPPFDPSGLSRAMGEILKLESSERQELGARARERVLSMFSLTDVASQYVNVYLKLGSTKPTSE